MLSYVPCRQSKLRSKNYMSDGMEVLFTITLNCSTTKIILALIASIIRMFAGSIFIDKVKCVNR